MSRQPGPGKRAIEVGQWPAHLARVRQCEEMSMSRETTFTFRVDEDERELIRKLAQRLQRTESDTVRLIIREAAQALMPAQGENGQTAVE